MSVDLTQLEERYQKEAVTLEEIQPVPDGTYDAGIERVTMGQNRKGMPTLNWRIRLRGPEVSNRAVWHQNLLRPESLRWLAKDLKTCGITLKSITELPNRLAELEGLKVMVTLTTKNDFQNVRLNQLLEEPPA